MAIGYFKDFDFTDFWSESSYSQKKYTEAPPSKESIASIEQQLGYKLPQAYIELMKIRNGGLVNRCCFPTQEATSWAEDHIAITGIMGIGRTKTYSLCGSLGSQFMQEEWGYPDIGICVCDAPSAGHDMIMLDYRKCGKDGEPEVVHVDQESDYRVTFLAHNFAEFINGLVAEEVFDTSEQDYQLALSKITTGKFSDLLTTLCENSKISNIEQIIRHLSLKILEEKRYFALHADPLSYLLYDIQFLLYSSGHIIENKQQYLDIYSTMIAFGGEFSTGGYAPAFIEDWLASRLREVNIKSSKEGLQFAETFKTELLEQMSTYAFC